jgi:hypothetical protein
LYNHNNSVQTGYNNSYKSVVDSSHHQAYYYNAYLPKYSTHQFSVYDSKHNIYQSVDYYYYQDYQCDPFCGLHNSGDYSTF